MNWLSKLYIILYAIVGCFALVAIVYGLVYSLGIMASVFFS